MRKIIDPFTYCLPRIDLHGHDRYSFTAELDGFIKYLIKNNNYKFVIIHGKGEGILKENIHLYLKKNKNVNNYYIDNINDGQTIVEITGGKTNRYE